MSQQLSAVILLISTSVSGLTQTLDSTLSTRSASYEYYSYIGGYSHVDYRYALMICPDITFSDGFQPGIQLGMSTFDMFGIGFSGIGLTGSVAYNIRNEDLIIGGNAFAAAIILVGGPNVRLGANYHFNDDRPFTSIKVELGFAITAVFFNYMYERNISNRSMPRNMHSFNITTYIPAITWNRKGKSMVPAYDRK